MQKNEKKIVNCAEATKKRIIAYSNDDLDEYHLVAENQEGNIAIFFEKENTNYSKVIENNLLYKEQSKAKFIQYIVLCNYIYIVWLLASSLALNNFFKNLEETCIIIFLNMFLFFLFSVTMLKNKYAKEYMFFLVISMISDNMIINFISYFVEDITLCFKILLKMAFIAILFIMLFEYGMFFIRERKRIEERGKHSAEHMMCNYIEKYQTYPKNVKEIKKASRFCIDCGGLYGDCVFENIISLCISSVVVILASITILEKYEFVNRFIAYDKIGLIFSTILCGVIFTIIFILIDLLQSLIYFILIILSQIANTLPKRKVKYRDLKMAQMLSEKFFEWQYPNEIEPNKKTN